MGPETSDDPSFTTLRAQLLAELERLRHEQSSPEEFLRAAGEALHGLPLYPPAVIRALGAALADDLDRSPALAVDVTLGLMSSPAREVRALAATILSRLARFQPGMWVEPGRHLVCDEDWEVRDLAARVFDLQDDFEGAAGFHLEFVCDVLRQWAEHADERVRRAATQALLGFAAANPPFRPRLLQLLAPLLNDPQEYVRHSLAAALRVLGRADAELVFGFIEARLDPLTDGAREVFRLVLDHPFAARHPERKAELFSHL
ncbi:MAG: DNA alkylation repair protein [bacterium]|nr:DNA alkylation repair protein [bacterium]